MPKEIVTMDIDGDSASNAPSNSSRKRSREESESSSEKEGKLSPLPPVIGEDGAVTFSLSAVHENFICSLCSGYYREPYTVTDCLHTFCKSCLLYSVACGCHECPECHLFVGSDPMKAATLDTTLQELISVIFPYLEKQEEQEMKEFYEKRGIALKPKDTSTDQSSDNSASQPSEKPSSSNMGDNKKDELEVTLLPERVSNGEQLKSLDRPFIRVSGRLKMHQLKRYIVQKLALPSDYKHSIDILCNGVPVGDEISLSFANRLLWPHECCLELTYKLSNSYS